MAKTAKMVRVNFDLDSEVYESAIEVAKRYSKSTAALGRLFFGAIVDAGKTGRKGPTATAVLTFLTAKPPEKQKKMVAAPKRGAASAAEDAPKRRGRPPGSKNKPKEMKVKKETKAGGKRRGRPVGSKNKPKDVVAEAPASVATAPEVKVENKPIVKKVFFVRIPSKKIAA